MCKYSLTYLHNICIYNDIPIFYVYIYRYFFLSSPYSKHLFQGPKVRDMNVEDKIGLPQSKCMIETNRQNFCSFCCI